eukprot:366333-Chlamydomonas_euryale.AAC.4
MKATQQGCAGCVGVVAALLATGLLKKGHAPSEEKVTSPKTSPKRPRCDHPNKICDEFHRGLRPNQLNRGLYEQATAKPALPQLCPPSCRATAGPPRARLPIALSYTERQHSAALRASTCRADPPSASQCPPPRRSSPPLHSSITTDEQGCH